MTPKPRDVSPRTRRHAKQAMLARSILQPTAFPSIARGLCLALLVCAGPAIAQTRPTTTTAPTTSPATAPATAPAAVPLPKLVHDLATGPGGDLAAVVALEGMADQYAAGRERDLYIDVLATRLIFVGDHQKAAELNSKAYAAMRPRQAVSDGSELDGYTPAPAVETILKLTAGRRVLMLNEEHRSSRERAFAHELLEPLHAAGFTHLALETIGDPAGIHERKYPLMTDGFYTRDPILGDLVRRAAQLGMGIVQYEADMRQMPADIDRNDPVSATNWRERQQAENLARFLEANPGARLIVWSGRHHMSEDDPGAGVAGGEGQGQWTPMGGIFKQITKIDPLTVDLMVLNEQGTREAEHRTYRWATEQGLVQQPTVFVNDEGRPWSPIDSLDAAVFFPRTEWLRGRPSWLRMGGERLGFGFDWSEATDAAPQPGRPLIVEARLQGEGEEAIALDRVIWRDGPAPPLFVRPGRSYRLILRDPEGAVLAERLLNINAAAQ